MHRITYEQLDDKGAVVHKVVWDVPDEGGVNLEERCPVSHIYEVGHDTPFGTNRGPITLHLTATIDPLVRFVPRDREVVRAERCLEQRSKGGGCDTCAEDKFCLG